MRPVQLLKSIARRAGAAARVKQFLQVQPELPFHTLSPDLLVALVRAFDLLKNTEGRAFYEFGLYQGFSLWFAEQIARGRVASDFMFYGFDSFEGLPPTSVDSGYYQAGQFAADYETVKSYLTEFTTDWSRVKLFRGFYSDELFEQLAQCERFLPVSIAVIDVDIYESCVPVLNFLEPFLQQDSILIFDDYNDMRRSDQHGERKALKEFLDRTGIELSPLFEIGRECAGFVVAKR